jgi:6-phosphogluconolactonase
MTIERRSFADKPTLAKELAEAVADRIRAAISTHGVAAIAVSGGSTPGRFFQALGGRTLGRRDQRPLQCPSGQ